MEAHEEEPCFDAKLVHLFENLSLESSNDGSKISFDVESSLEAESSKSSVSQDEDIGSDGGSSTSSVLSHTAQSFRALGKIVNFMRRRYQSGMGTEPLTLEEILEETKQVKLNVNIREWLSKEALCNNKRIEVSENGRYQFKPTYQLRNIDDLIELLKEHERKGLGGVLMDDIRDSLPNYRKVLKDCDARVFVLKRPMDRKNIVFYNDHETPVATDLQMQAMWRALGLEDIEEVCEPLEDSEIEH